MKRLLLIAALVTGCCSQPDTRLADSYEDYIKAVSPALERRYKHERDEDSLQDLKDLNASARALIAKARAK